jgi:hypothetical protein
MPAKQNLFYALFLGAILSAPNLGAGEAVTSVPVHLPAPRPQTASAPIRTEAALLENWLKHLRERNRDQVFAALSKASQERYGRTAKTFMHTVRLYHTALYNHVRFELITAETTNPDNHLYKIDLYDHHGTKSLALLRLIKDTTGSWQVEAITVITPTKGRDA